MTRPLGNEDLSAKVGERVIDHPELPPSGITNENDVHTEMIPASCSSNAATPASSRSIATSRHASAARTITRHR